MRVLIIGKLKGFAEVYCMSHYSLEVLLQVVMRQIEVRTLDRYEEKVDG